jgi:hypothetical protein
VCASGCGSIYLHSDNTQKAAESAQSDFKAGDPSTMFTVQSKNFATLASAESDYVRSRIASRRDLQLIMILNGQDARSDLTDRLAKLTGWKAADLNAKLRSLGTGDERLRTDHGLVDERTSAVADYQRLLIQSGGDLASTNCAAAIASSNTAPSATDKEEALQLLKGACADLLRYQDQLTANVKDLSSPSGDLFLTTQTLTKLTDNLSKQQAQAAGLKAILDQETKAINAAQSAETTTIAATLLTLCAADPSSAETKAAATAAAAAAQQDPPLANAVSTCFVAGADDADPVVKLAQHEFLAGQIQQVIDAVLASNPSASSTNPSAAPTSTVGKSTTIAVKTITDLAQVADQLDRNSLPSINSLLVARAYEQHQIALNQIRIQSINEHIVIYTAKRDAIVTEIAHLARALLLDASSSATALTEINSAWNSGRYWEELADYADIDLVRRDSLRTSQEIAATWTDLLQPGFSELVAYGQGGIDPQTLASFITAAVNAAGFSAVSARVGK